MRLSIRTNLRLDILIRIFVLFLPFLLLPLFALAAEDEDDFSIYHAETRPAQELATMAQQMTGVRASHMNDKIVIYGPKKKRDAALRLVKELDKPARMYRVHVRAISRGEAAREAAAVEGGIGSGNVKIGKGKSGVLKGGGGKISVGDFSASAERQEMEGRGQGQQQVSVIDGGTAEIGASSGLFPSGAQVTLRSSGKHGAHLKLKQQEAKGYQRQSLDTEIDVKLGVWRTIGSVKDKRESQDSELLGKSAEASASAKDIQVMVELDQN